MGAIIALSGIDGSGKTTISKTVVKVLSQEVRVSYHHELDFIFLTLIFEIMKRFSRSESARLHKYVTSNYRSNYTLVAIYYFLIWLDSLIVHIFFKLRRGFVVFDRCTYDYVTAIRYLGYPKSLIEKLFTYFPRPDICILLNPDPKVAWLRKKGIENHPLSYFEIQIKRYVALAHSLNYDAIIDSNKTIEEVANDVLLTIRKSKPKYFSTIHGLAS